MSRHSNKPSPPPRTYMPRPPLEGRTLTCSRCHRIHPYPADGGPAIRCECGWSYANRNGRIVEEFKSRLGA